MLQKKWILSTVIFLLILVFLIYIKNAVGSEFTFIQRTPREHREAGLNSNYETIKIGLAGPKELIEGNTLFYQGVNMAVEEINKQGGITGRMLETVVGDDEDSLAKALDVAQQFSNNEEITAVIGHWNSEYTIPCAQIYNHAGVLMIAPVSTNPILTQKGYDMVFRNTVTDELTGQQMAQYAWSQGYQNIAIYYADSALGENLSKSFEEYAGELGLNIIDRHTYFVNKSEFEVTYQKWEYLNVDAVFMAEVMTNSREVIGWIREENKDIPILGGDGFDYENFVSYIGEDSENIAFASFLNNNTENKLYQTFADTFSKIYGKKPDYWAIKGYDSIYLIKYAIEEAESTSPSKMAQALLNIHDFQTVNGSIEFKENGDMIGGEIVIKRVANGQFKYIYNY